MHTLLIQYLIEIIKYQRRLIILLALWLFQFISNSRMPQPDKPIYKRFNQFEVDEAVPLLAADIQPEKLDYQELLAQHLTDTGKPIKAVRRRKPIDFQALRCARCDAPSDYLYANNGKGGQLECKVCHFKFQRRDGDYKKDVSLRCPYCTHALYLHNKRVNFDVWVCPNDNCSYRQGKVAQLSPKQLAAFSAEPTRFKVRYTYRDFRFELKSVDADSPIQTTVDLGRIRATPQVLGLVLTYHINYGMSARKTAALMYDVHGIKISHQTIHNYEEAVAAVVRPFWANYPYKLSEELVGDETYIRVKGKWNYISPGKKEHAASQDALVQVDLAEFADRQIGSLSGGQLQRVFVARAIVQQAEIIILDEPFVGIDLQSETAIMKILKQWRDAGKTIIVVHHDLNKVSRYFDDFVVMNHGIIDYGPVQQVYTAQNIEKAFSADLSSVLFTEKEVAR